MSGVVLAPGAIFATDYKIVRPLSEGGMGAVYVVDQLSTGKQRALKVMHAKLLRDEKQVQRFIQEAKMSGKIESDHVVEVLAAGVEDKAPWLAMELLVGETLEDRIEKKGPSTPKDVCEIFTQLCHAIAAAHDVGIVHRDLKPENVFLSNPRRVGVPFTVKVLDFGIAKLVAESGSTTQAIGSPLWMAPEQTDASSLISPATDVWALGLLAFASLTGKYFWKSAQVEVPNPITIVMEVCFDPLVPASERAAELGVGHLIPPGFDAWFAHCVNRDIGERFQKVRELQAELAPILTGESAVTSRSTAPSSPMQTPSLLTPAPSPTPFGDAIELELDLPKPKPKAEPSKPAPSAEASGAHRAPTVEASGAHRAPTVEASGAHRAPSAEASGAHRAPSADASGGYRASEPRPRAQTLGHTTTTKPLVGVTRQAARQVDKSQPFPWAKAAGIGVLVLGGLFVAQRFFWTTPTKAPEPQPSQTATEAPTPSAAPSPKASVAPAAPCPAGMVRIPGGEVVVGDPAMAVDTFCIDVTEVTVKAYGECVKSGKCTAASTKGDWMAATPEEKKERNESCNSLVSSAGGKADRSDHPINCVDALQADAYCKAQGKRLPNDLEFVWATRSATARFKYPWGPESPDVQLCWSAFKSRTSTCPVGSYPKGDNAYGVHDLAGNVREWTSTAHGNDRTHCGSDWTDKIPDDLFKLGYCGESPEKSKSAFLGFRCAQ